MCNLNTVPGVATVDDQDGPKAPRLVGTFANISDVTIGGKPNSSHYFVGRADVVTITIG